MNKKLKKRLMEDIAAGKVDFPVCPECNGSGYIRIHQHWYSTGTKVVCTYCDGIGKLTWSKEE